MTSQIEYSSHPAQVGTILEPQPAPGWNGPGFPRRGLLGALHPGDIHALAGLVAPAWLPKDRRLSRAGAANDTIWFLGSGLVGCALLLADGRRVGLSVESGGGLVGGGAGLDGAAGADEASMLVAGFGWRISRRHLLELAERRPTLALSLAGHYARRNQRLETELACSMLHGVVARLARALTHAFDVTGRSVLTITQEELAVMLRTQRTTVSQAAVQLKAQGAIGHLRGAVRLIDGGRLRAMACGCCSGVDQTGS